MVKNKCPFLSHNKYCDIKTIGRFTTKKRTCSYKDCKDCLLFQESLTKLKFDEEKQSDNKNA